MNANVGSKRNAPPPRKASPSRQDASEELTFKQKLDEIKKLRLSGVATVNDTSKLSTRISNEEPIVPKQVQTVTGVKTFLKSFASWVEVVSKSGKVYYYNKKTQENQWKKPDEWVAEEIRLNPPLPASEEPVKPPEPPTIETNQIPLPQVPKVKLKFKPKKKVAKKMKKESKIPLAYQKNPLKESDSDSDNDNIEQSKLSVENVFEDPNQPENGCVLERLDKVDEIGHIDIRLKEESNVKKSDDVNVSNKEEKDDKPKEENFKPNAPGHVRANHLVKGSAAHLAFQNISKIPESTAIYGDGAMFLNKSETGNDTYFTEYNLPCCLKRCKFPKEQDVLHELKINKLKRRNFCPPSHPGLDPKLAHLADEAELEHFYTELKNYNHHDRLLTSRMNGVFVYKVLDEIWDRYFHKFQIKIFSGVYLECRPSGYSHNDELIYSRTGKACGFKTFPEDEVRCQAVLQAWNKDSCLCVYANRIFTVKRDDKQWDEDLYEMRKFLEKNGY